MADGAHVVAADAGGGCGVQGIGGVLAFAAEHGGEDVERVHRELECIEIRAELIADGVQARLQQWNPERYGNGTIEDWEITVFSEPFEDLLKT